MKTKKIAVLGMMMALTELLVWTPFGMIPLPLNLSATIGHLPTIIVALLEGPIAGIIMGVFFGLSTLIRAYIAPQGAFDLLFQDPVLSVVPRIFIGVSSYYVYAWITPLIKKHFVLKTVAIGISASIGSLTNTFLVLSVLYFKYQAVIEGNPLIFVGTVLATSGIAEMIMAMVSVTAIVTALQVTYKKQ